MKVILTLSGDEVFVDDAFHEILSTKHWYTIKSDRTSYARCYHKGEHLYMHRLVMEEPEGLTIDHLDGNGMNNQRCNLEAVSGAENTRRMNKRLRSGFAYARWKAMDEAAQFTTSVNCSKRGKSRNYQEADFMMKSGSGGGT